MNDITITCILEYEKVISCNDNKPIIDNLEKLLLKLPNSCEQIIFYQKLALNFNSSKNSQLAKKYSDKAKKLAQTKKCSSYQFYIFLQEYQLFRETFQNDLALAKMMEAEKFYLDNQLQFKYDWMQLQNNMAAIYYHTENYASAEKHLQRVLEIVKEEKYLNRDAISSYNTLGLVQKNIGRYEEAKKSFLEVIKIAKSTGDSIWIAIPEGNLAEIDILNKDYQSAEKRLKIYQDYAIKYREHGIIVASFTKLAHLCRLRNDLDTSLEYLRKAEMYFFQNEKEIRRISLNSFLKYQQRIFEEFLAIFEQKKNYPEAFRYAQKLLIIKDSISRVSHKNKIYELENTYKFGEQVLENKMLKEKSVLQQKAIEYNHKITIGIVVASIFAILFAVYMYYYSQIKNKYAKHLEETNHFKSKVFSIVSHDIRSYMSSLKGYVYLVKNQELDEDTFRELNQELAKNTEYAFSLMDNLLLWAKSQLQQQKNNFEVHDMNKILQNVIFEVGWFAQNKQIEIIINAAKSLEIETDFNLITIALRNILNNAIKFSETGGRIEIRLEEDNNYCKIIVEDNGTGISPENLQKIKNRVSFTQRGTQLEKGTGLGLLLIQDTIRNLNGTFEIESVWEQGTKVTITLPIYGKNLNRKQTKIAKVNENFVS